jgi:hypothetical protein
LGYAAGSYYSAIYRQPFLNRFKDKELWRMRAKEVFRMILAAGLASLSLSLPARSGQADRSQSGSSGSNVAVPSRTPSNPSGSALGDFGWLEGHWRGDWGTRIAEQVWLSPKAGAMEGVFRVVEAEKTLVLELFTLVQKPEGISLYVRHFTPTLAPWEKSDATVLNLAKIENKKFTFENSVNGMPKVATFTRIDADTYLSRSEIVPETGDAQATEITYKRQPAPTPAVNAGSGARQKKP